MQPLAPKIACAAAALLLLLGAGCSEPNLLPGTTLPANSFCAYPRACYLLDVSQCGDCNGGPGACRRVLGGCGQGSGAMASCAEPPKATDPGIICPIQPDGGAQLQMVCALPETICVARGPRCDGYCVRAGARCDTGARISVQHGVSDGGDSACPYTDDVCCPVPRDMSGADQGISDGGPVDGAPRG